MVDYGFDHVHLISPDPLKTAQFYEQVVGANRGDVRELQDGRIRVYLDLHGTRILIHHPKVQSPSARSSPDARYGLDHFGLKTDNIEAAVAEFKAKGVTFEEVISEGRPGSKRAWLWAPENVRIELVERGG